MGFREHTGTVALGAPDKYFGGGYKQLSLCTVIPIWNSPRTCGRNLLEDYCPTRNYSCPETSHSPRPRPPPPAPFLQQESDVEGEAGLRMRPPHRTHSFCPILPPAPALPL